MRGGSRASRAPPCAASRHVGVGRREHAPYPADGVHGHVVRRAPDPGVRRRAQAGEGHRRHTVRRVGVPDREHQLPPTGSRPGRGAALPAAARRSPAVGSVVAGDRQRQRAPLPRLRFHRTAPGPRRRRDHVMTAAGVVGVLVQVAVVVGGAPLLVGLMRQVRALLEGRAGAGVGQPWRDLRKLLKKEAVRPEGTSWIYTSGPLVLFASTLVIAAVAPFVSTASPLDGVADLFAVVSLLLLGTVALTLAGLDTGTAFGGMGASREVTIAALAEPTILLAGFALSARVGSSNLAALVEGMLTWSGQHA